MRRSYRFRLCPTGRQVERLQKTLDICRELYNAALEERRAAWKSRGIAISCFDQIKQLPAVKKVRPDVAEVYSQVLCDVLRRLDKTFQAFFRRCKNGERPGYPRFKGPNRYDSLTYPQPPYGAVLKGNRLHLSKIGDVKIRLHRQIKGTVKTVTIKREAGKWYAVFSCDKVPAQPLPKTGKAIGIDVGLEAFATLSDGTQIENPKWYRKAEGKLKMCHRVVSKRKLGSKRRAKAVSRLQVAYARVRNQRLDFHHKLARFLVNNYDVVVAEDLNVNGMVRNPYLAKSIGDAGWGRFMRLLLYKAAEAGREVVLVNPQWTSQTCSRCGSLVKKGLSQRWHLCPACGLSLHRDHNAALEILRLGLSLRRGARDAAPAPMTREADRASGQQAKRLSVIEDEAFWQKKKQDLPLVFTSLGPASVF